ncbi:hypothetical protein JZ751_002122 [Albula glossodonta]|uniref:B-cell lymphoma 9 beta-catenin binding domain-containing protein n=1 Tax=Albula glossodonta TaxID=121402 RepID=A0A8T2PHU8_9TELE|nr:hypothetical protein JZ751_002122 [Albula glossodonta]
MRSKRRCVLEKKQPYSGDEWYSGPDTEEDDDKPPTVPHRELSMAGPVHSGPSPMGPISESSGSALGRGVGPGLHSELPRPHQQVVYVFTTSLANSAAEAVMHGHADSILLFHQQNVPRTKLDQCSSVKLPCLSEQLSSGSTPPTGTPKSQSATPRPASVGGAVGGHMHPSGTPISSGHPEDEPSIVARTGVASGNMGDGSTPHQAGGGGGSGPGGPGGCLEGPGLLPHPAPGGTSPSPSLQGDLGSRGEVAGNVDGLSKEQLEHRERSLQTLRDIERLLLRSGGPGDSGGPNGGPNSNNINLNNNSSGPSRGNVLENSDGGVPPGSNPGNCNNSNNGSVLKKYVEEPLQSMMSQPQNMGGPGPAGLDDPQMGGALHGGLPPHPHPHHHPHPHLSSPTGLDMGPLLGPDGLTPEQVAWRKLQEEYYQEKRRQQEAHPHHHYRMMPEMGMGGMIRGPPPPYHSKPGDPQWGPGPGPMMGGSGGGNGRMMDMHGEGPRAPRFLGPMQRGLPRGGGPVGGGYPGNPPPGGVLPMEAMGHQRPPRPGMGWLEDMGGPPNVSGGGGGPFQGCYPPGSGGGPPIPMQGDPDRPLTREEMFRLLEKRQLQGLHRLELDRLAKQQQAGLGGFPNPQRGDPMDFPSSRAMMGSPIGGGGVGQGGGVGGGGPSMRDLVDSPLGPNFGMNVNMNVSMGMNPQLSGQQQQQQMMLTQKMRAGQVSGGGAPLTDMLSPEEISQIRAAQNGRGGGSKGSMIPCGGQGPLQFPNQGPFSGPQPSSGGGGYLQEGPEMFSGPDQQGPPPHMGGTSRLSHMPRGSVDLGQRHPSDLSINVNPMGSPSMPPPHQLKSPSLSQEASPLMPSPSASAPPGLKSPTGGPPPPPPSLPPSTGAGTPSSSMKSPQVMGPTSTLGLRSPSVSPGRLRSPAMPIASPGWTTSPKPTLPSPVGPPSGKGGSSSTETGPSLPPRSSNSTPISQPGSMNPSMPFSSSPDAPPTQNPLSLIMSQMSKYAMPSSTPLYHEAIKTIATSDDEMPPDRPLLPGINMAGNMGNHQPSQMLGTSQSSMGPHSGSQSPMGMVLQGQPQLSHDPSGPMLHSPNPMGLPGMNPAMIGGGGGGPPEGLGPCNVSPMLPQNQMGGFSRMQAQPHGALHSPSSGMGPQYPQPPPEDIMPHHQLHLLGKRPPHPPEPPFHPMAMGGEGPDLSDVIRPTPTGIPEFDLSRIIPSDKPSSTLQYFPKSEGPPPPPSQGGHLKQHPHPHPSSSSSAPPPSSSNPHLANLQNMMAEQQLSHPHPGMRTGGLGMGGPPRGGGSGGMGPMCHPGHPMGGRTGLLPQQQHHHMQQQQVMMANSLLHHPSHPHPHPHPHHPHPGMMSPQQNLIIMQSKQRGMPMPVPGDPYTQQGPLMSPQGPMMGPPHPQSGMMGPQGPLRQRGMSLDSPLGYGPPPGGLANMPF